MNRLVEFAVEHPNLNRTPKNITKGKKRYYFHKNNNSVGFDISTSNQNHEIEKKEEVSVKNYLYKLKDLLYTKTKELENLEIVSKNFSKLKNFQDSPKFPVFRKENSMTPTLRDNFSYSGVFFQHKYTKSNPKVFDNNPIVGYSTRKALSPDRKLVNYGNMIFNNNLNKIF